MIGTMNQPIEQRGEQPDIALAQPFEAALEGGMKAAEPAARTHHRNHGARP